MAVVSVRAFAPLMTQRVRIARKTSGYDDYGNQAYGSDVSYQAAIIGKITRVTTAGGEEAVSGKQVVLMSNAAFTPEDRITLSTEDVGSTELWALQPEILSVNRFPFLRGQFVTEIFCK